MILSVELGDPGPLAKSPLVYVRPATLRGLQLKKNLPSKSSYSATGQKKGLQMRPDILSLLFRSLRASRDAVYILLLLKFSSVSQGR